MPIRKATDMILLSPILHISCQYHNFFIVFSYILRNCLYIAWTEIPNTRRHYKVKHHRLIISIPWVLCRHHRSIVCGNLFYFWPRLIHLSYCRLLLLQLCYFPSLHKSCAHSWQDCFSFFAMYLQSPTTAHLLMTTSCRSSTTNGTE